MNIWIISSFWLLWIILLWISSVQLSRSVVSDSCYLMECSSPGLPVHHQHPEFTQTHVHWVGEGIQPSHPLLSPFPTFNLSQHQGLFKWVSSWHLGGQSIVFSALTSVLPMNIQDWSPLGWTGWISLQSKGLISNTTVQNNKFFSA